MIKVEAPARLHFGFSNLSLSRSRIYGGIGVSVSKPKTVVMAEMSNEIDITINTDQKYERIQKYVEKSADILDIPGAEVKIEKSPKGHVGLGSGTQLALSIFTAVAKSYGSEPNIRQVAPKLGRGGRSGVGVAAFETGGFLIDSGHSSKSFTRCLPKEGKWEVPEILALHYLPETRRFIIAIPEAQKIYGKEEEKKIQETVFNASSSIAEEISSALIDKVLPGAAEEDFEEFSNGIEIVNRLNGSWFSELQGGIYRDKSQKIIELFRKSEIKSTGQSSWGPAVYGITKESKVDYIMKNLDLDNADILVAKPRNEGAKVREI